MDGPTYKYIRKKLRVTQGDVAENLNVTQAQISNIESSANEIEQKYISYLIDVSKKINVDINDIIKAYELEKSHINTINRKNYLADTTSTHLEPYSKPYYAIDVFGSPGMDIIDQEEQYAEPMFYISVPELKHVDIYIRVTGDSMYPKYRHGDIIGIKKLNAREFFAWYEPYVVVTRGNYQRLLKYIHPHPEDENKLLLVSYDSNKFPPQPIDKDAVHEIWQVLGKIEL